MNEEGLQALDFVKVGQLSEVLPTLRLRGTILLVTSKGFVRRNVAKTLIDCLPESSVTTYDSVKPNPELQDLHQVMLEFSKRKITGIVALGGGSVLDSAKVLSLWLANHDMSFEQLCTKSSKANSKIPLIAIPTTAGTGAEVTPFATVWDSPSQKKYSLSDVRPDIAILDCMLTIPLPVEETLYSAMDALSHALESLWNINRTTQTEKYAQQAIELLSKNLPRVMDDPADVDARSALQIAAIYSGLAITQTKTAIAHAISYPLTLQYGVPHGLACSITLLSILDKFGNQELNLSDELADKVIRLLMSLKINTQLEKYISWDEVLKSFDPNLDPSRAGNFILTLDASEIIDVLARSQRIANGTC